MRLILTFFLLASPVAYGLDLSCSRTPIHLDWAMPLKVAHGRAYGDGGSNRVVYMRKYFTSYGPRREYTELRVSNGGFAWSILCLTAAQKAVLGL
jgi:hypothetical protein